MEEYNKKKYASKITVFCLSMMIVMIIMSFIKKTTLNPFNIMHLENQTIVAASNGWVKKSIKPIKPIKPINPPKYIPFNKK